MSCKGIHDDSVKYVKRKKSYKRGYSVALLVGCEEDHAVLWQIFSRVAKPHVTLRLDGNRADGKVLYNFHESVIDALRPLLKEGVRSVVVTAPTRTTYAADFLNHVRKHHSYLMQSGSPNRTAFAELTGSADQPHNVAELVKTKEFRMLIAETTSGEADDAVDALETHLYGADVNRVVLFAFKEIEDMIYSRERNKFSQVAYLLLTDKYLADCQDKNRVHRLLQISKNREVKSRVVDAESSAGKRLSQLGGIVFFTTLVQNKPKTHVDH
jgi:stalled ribosome rescue protein Dom34